MSVEIKFRIIGDEEQTKNGIKSILVPSDGGTSAGVERDSTCCMSFL
jgi:hypothetical protein